MSHYAHGFTFEIWGKRIWFYSGFKFGSAHLKRIYFVCHSVGSGLSDYFIYFNIAGGIESADKGCAFSYIRVNPVFESYFIICFAANSFVSWYEYKLFYSVLWEIVYYRKRSVYRNGFSGVEVVVGGNAEQSIIYLRFRKSCKIVVDISLVFFGFVSAVAASERKYNGNSRKYKGNQFFSLRSEPFVYYSRLFCPEPTLWS